ncbi:MAG: hypothetical protein HY721_26385, partial [Planctomycetes bacterium]|nr:hypothetical protein [Planctomycetota bacterium]
GGGGGEGERPRSAPREARTDGAGAFLLRGLEPGDYAVAGVEVPFSSEVAVAAGRRSRLEVRLETFHYRLRVADAATGSPWDGEVEAEVREVRGTRSWRGAARGGAFEAEGLLAGQHRVRVWTGRLLRHDAVVEVEGDVEQRLPLAPQHEVSVRLLVADDEPFRGEAEVTVLAGDVELYRATETIDETLTVPTPGPGEYVIVVRSPDRTARIGVVVSEDSLDNRTGSDDNRARP